MPTFPNQRKSQFELQSSLATFPEESLLGSIAKQSSNGIQMEKKRTKKKEKNGKNGKKTELFLQDFEVFSLKNALVYHHCIAIAVSLLARNEKQTCIARSPMPVPVLQHRGVSMENQIPYKHWFPRGGLFPAVFFVTLLCLRF